MNPNEITRQIVDAACHVHTRLGPGDGITRIVNGLPEEDGSRRGAENAEKGRDKIH